MVCVHMKEADRIWFLMARKLSGEATPEELAELARFQQEHPDQTYSLQVLADLWHAQQREASVAREAKEAEDAFQRHLTRMALRDVTREVVNPAPSSSTHHGRFRASLELFLNYFKIA